MSLKKFHINQGELIYDEDFIDPTEAIKIFDALKEEIHWRQENFKIFGKTIPFPRLTAWYGDTGIAYRYSNLRFTAEAWTDTLKKVRGLLNEFGEFNSVLLNYYRNGDDSMSWHADNEIELGLNPVIASLNFGATRKFQLKHNVTKELVELELKNGSLLVMAGETQHWWKHQVPKTKKVLGGRINLTFRRILF